MYSALSHTHALTCGHTHTHVHSHVGTLTHRCTHMQSHTYTHMHSRIECTHIHPTCAPTHAHIRAGSNLRKLPLVLEVRAPKPASLHGAFPDPTAPPEPRLGPRPGCPQSPGSWMLLGEANVASGFGGGQGAPGLKAFRRGLTEQLALHHGGACGLTTPISPGLKAGGGRITDRQRPGVTSGSTDTGNQPWGAGPPGEGVLGTWDVGRGIMQDGDSLSYTPGPSRGVKRAAAEEVGCPDCVVLTPASV